MWCRGSHCEPRGKMLTVLRERGRDLFSCVLVFKK